jgi:spermidine/putrescine transport system substrate-binding protein
MMKISVRTVAVRFCICLFWIGAIFAFLFLPRVSRIFAERKSISLCIFPMILDAKVLTQFERETGIKVYLNYFESNEELLSKLRVTKGKGYDLIVPTDYMVELLIKEGLLKPLDKSKLSFIPTLKPYLLGNYFDPNNDYSVPYYMSIFGLGINKNYFGGTPPPATWGMVFDPQRMIPHICMLDSAREALLMAAFYLYGRIDLAFTPEQLQAIAQVLIEQKKNVDVYTSARAEELLASGSCPIAVGTSPDVWKAMREYPNIDFVIPHEGSFVTLDSFVMPAATAKDDLVYTLLNYLYKYEVLQHNSRKYGFCPPTTTVAAPEPGVMCPDAQQFKKLNFFRNVLTQAQIQDTWILVKSR